MVLRQHWRLVPVNDVYVIDGYFPCVECEAYARDAYRGVVRNDYDSFTLRAVPGDSMGNFFVFAIVVDQLAARPHCRMDLSV